MRVIFMGTPAFAIPVLEALCESKGVEVVGVYSAPDRPSGRGLSQEMPPVKKHAMEHGLEVRQPATLRSARVQAELAALQPDVIVVVAYGKFLPPEVLKLPPHGCLNLHPSLLPRYRGPSPVVTAILEGETTTGITLMLLDEGMDTGPIIVQQTHPISPIDTAEILTTALFQQGAELLRKNIGLWMEGKLTAQPQDQGKATVTHKLERADGLANWQLSAQDLDRRRRAYTPWPGLFTHWQGKVLKLLETSVILTGQMIGTDYPGTPGLVVPLPMSDTPVGIMTGEGILVLKTVQLEGRRAVSSVEFLRGYPEFLHSRV